LSFSKYHINNFFSENKINKKEYLILPNINTPRIAVPLKNIRLFINGLKIQNTASLKNRILKKILPVFYPLFKATKINVFQSTNYLEQLKNKINSEKIWGLGNIDELSAFIGTENSRNRKITFILFDNEGKIKGILKFPVERSSIKFMENEQNILQRLQQKELFRKIAFPGRIEKLCFDNKKLFLQEYIFGGTFQFKNKLNNIIVSASAELGNKNKDYTKINAYFHNIFDNIDKNSELKFTISQLKRDKDFLVRYNLPVVTVHGDYVLYNMQTNGTKAFLIDWEYTREGLPLFDLFHFVFQGKFQIEKKSHIECVKEVFSDSNLAYYKYYLNHLNLPVSLKIIKRLFYLYLIDNYLFDKKIKIKFNNQQNHFYSAIKLIEIQ